VTAFKKFPGPQYPTTLNVKIDKKRAEIDRQRLAEIAEKMKTAKGKALDALVAEVDKIIGFETGDAEYNARAVPEQNADEGQEP
jgi:hypothetical protein